MASRVLLMIERDGRVVCEGQYSESMNDWGVRTRGTRRQRDAQRRASRWWLVEAESAEAARVTINWHGREVEIGRKAYKMAGPGRILASGGGK